MVSSLSAHPTPTPTPPRGLHVLRTPYVLLVVATLVLGGIVWTVALGGSDTATRTVACPAPPEGATAELEEQPADALDDEPPALLADTRIRVLNANGESGQAGAVAAQLAERGFRTVGADATGNDPVYGQSLECNGQIRFGESGRSTARSLSLAAPCMQLISDGREDATVDLALGTIFSELTDSAPAVAALDELEVGRQPAAGDLEAARAVSC